MSSLCRHNMRHEAERNPLDLNNLPDDSTRDGKLVLDEDSSSPAGWAGGGGQRKKKSGAKDGKYDYSGKVYQCRFCSLKFCKSQALGGHMNRHRQERETETLNQARQLVFNNDSVAASVVQGGGHHLSGQPIPYGTYNHQPVYPTTRLFSVPSSTILPPPATAQSYVYASPSRFFSYPSQFTPANDYLVGHVLSPNHPTYAADPDYTCIGAPVGPGFGSNRRFDLEISGGGGRDISLLNNQEEEGLNWGRSSYAETMHMCLDPSSINRFQEGF